MNTLYHFLTEAIRIAIDSIVSRHTQGETLFVEGHMTSSETDKRRYFKLVVVSAPKKKTIILWNETNRPVMFVKADQWDELSRGNDWESTVESAFETAARRISIKSPRSVEVRLEPIRKPGLDALCHNSTLKKLLKEK